MKRKADRGEEGQGLGYVLVISAVLLVFLVALVDLLWKEMHWMVKSQRTTELMHEADAAADRAMYALQKPGNWDAIPQGAVPGYNKDVTYEDVPGIRYKLRVQTANWTPYDRQIWPNEADFVPGGDPENMRTITVFATLTPTGQHKKLQVIVLKSSLSSALFAGGQVLIGGSADVHWGPVVSYATVSDAIPLGSIPGHPIFLAAGGITIGGVLAETKGVDSSNPMAGQSVDSHSTTIGTAPTVPLDYYKAAAMKLTAETGQPFYITGGCSPGFSLPTGMTDKTVVFFDTYDGKAWTGSVCSLGGNGVEVKKSGNTDGKGILVVMGDLDQKGTGKGVADMIPPPDCYPRFDSVASGCQNPTPENALFWEGFVYIAGNLSGSGNVKVYGSVYARSTAGLGGNLSIWYKSNNQAIGMLGKTLGITLWMPRNPSVTHDPPGSYP